MDFVKCNLSYAKINRATGIPFTGFTDLANLITDCTSSGQKHKRHAAESIGLLSYRMKIAGKFVEKNNREQ